MNTLTFANTLVGEDAIAFGMQTESGKLPFARMLAPVVALGDMSRVFCLRVLDTATDRHGELVTSQAMASRARMEARRHVLINRPRERWSFRAVRTVVDEITTDDGTVKRVPRKASSPDETDAFALWARLLRVTATNGDISDCGDDAVLYNAEAAHAALTAAIKRQKASNDLLAAEAKRRGIKVQVLRAEIKAEAERRGVTIKSVRAERGLVAK